MSSKRLIQLFVLVLVLFLAFKVVPLAGQWRQELNDEIEQLRAQRDRLQKLLEKEAEWKARLEQVQQDENRILSRSLPGTSPEVASARLQSLLRGYADAAGVVISALSLPEIERFGGWNLLREVTTLRGSEAEVMAFLERVEKGRKLLRVVGFEVRRERTQLYGSVAVIGFSPVEVVKNEDTTGSDSIDSR